MAENFGDANDGKIFGVDDGVASRGPHFFSAHAEKFQGRIYVTQGCDELCAVHLT
jgi:hypothetical protein